DFVEHYIPQELSHFIDVATISLQQDHFIHEELTSFYSDLLFRVSLGNGDGYIYFLFEHNLNPDLPIVFRLLDCMIDIWQTKRVKHRGNNVPFILPIVLYHGKEKRDQPKSMIDLFGSERGIQRGLDRFIPD